MEMKGQNKGQYMIPLVCFSIILFDLIAGILGIQAEIAQNKVQSLTLWIVECRDPSYTAFKLGSAAAILLAFAHAIANLLGGCHCVQSKQELETVTYNKRLAFASLVLSWITLVIGFCLLTAGVLSNSGSRKSCGVSHHRYFSIGGVVCFIHAMFAVCYYVSATAVDREEKKLNPPVHQSVPSAPQP
ncbi:protein DESIGUAL 2-like [Rutidosis leptorrhynchoides]|uniref:protein DESIGUAL 2-like n=1 Tax=Rutidosis leptorrhynchoides TaxID=125765 RepID=UPI003A9962C9